ncbi:MAG: hypothetical protein HYS87_02965 [Candidatus Colwellbacteria bacterium]|nr:hypothetical protein [Candidatus Colwellbacteria bacterium]
MFKLVASASIIILAGAIQPNVTLALVIALSALFSDWPRRLILVLIAAISVKFYAGLDPQAILFAFAALSGIAALQYLPWKKPICGFFAIIIATGITQLIGFELIAFLKTAIYNTALFFAVFYIIDKYAQKR